MARITAVANSSGTPPRHGRRGGCCSSMAPLGWRGGGWTPRSAPRPKAPAQSTAGAHPARVPRGHGPLARQRDADGS